MKERKPEILYVHGLKIDGVEIPPEKMEEMLENRRKQERLQAFEKGFPLGTVLDLGGEGGQKPVMIVAVDMADGVAHYKGVPHPSGLREGEPLLEFTHKDIPRKFGSPAVFHMGWLSTKMKYQLGIEYQPEME